MRYLPLAVIIAATMLTANVNVANAQPKNVAPVVAPNKKPATPVLEDKSKRPDLTVPGVNWAGRDLYIPVTNRGANGTDRATQLRVAMYRKDSKGFMQLVSTAVVPVGTVRGGQSISVKATMNQDVVNCTVIITVDYQNLIAEVNENNNSVQISYK